MYRGAIFFHELFEGFMNKAYMPFMNGLRTELKTRFSPHFEFSCPHSAVLPEDSFFRRLENISKRFIRSGPATTRNDFVRDEFDSWRYKWRNTEVSEGLFGVLDECDKSWFPIVMIHLNTKHTVSLNMWKNLQL